MDENCTNENYSNLNCINTVKSELGETHNHNLKMLAEQVSNLLVQIEEFKEVKVKIESEVLEDDLCSIQPTTFICQPDLDIKQDSESDRLSIPLITEVKEEVLGSSKDDSKCTSMLTDIPMTDTEKQDRKCPKAVAIMMQPPLLNALYKCPKYDCSFATTLCLSFQKHFATHYSFLVDTMVPCLYCDYKVACSSYLTHLEVKHGNCLFGCGDCFYRTTNSYFVTMHRELVHPLSEFNILQLEIVTSNRITADTTSPNLSEVVLPYNCEGDGFLSCPFKTLYFDDYLKHVEACHQVDGLGSFSSEQQSQVEAVMDGWLAKEVGPFQCRYCKKATVTHQEMGGHQAVFHAQEQCLFYYRKFVPNDTVIIPEQVNLKDSSFINHVIRLPDQIHLCDFKLMDGLLSSTSVKLTNWEYDVSLPLLPPPEKDFKADLDQSSVSLDKSECLLDEWDLLCLDKQPKGGDSHNDATVTAYKCKWDGCCQRNDSQAALLKHVEKDHIQLQRGEKFTCFWVNCPRNSKPYPLKWNLSRHVSFHCGEKPYKYSFQRSHTGEEPYLCQFSNCSRSFSSSFIRNNHQRMHYDTKAYACQVTGCSKKYAHRSNLWKHMRKHTVDEKLEAKRKSIKKKQKVGDFVLKKSSNNSDGTKCQRTHCNTKTYACQVIGCSKKYADRSNHWRHMRKHTFEEQLEAKRKLAGNKQKKNDLELKKSLNSSDTLQCNWKGCYETCHSQAILVNHIEKNHVQLQRGEEFTCFWIDCPRKSKPYPSKQNLSRHMSVHSGQKPYKCPFQGCNKAFSHSWSLTIHQRTSHTRERPYLCPFSNCFKRFITSYDRNNHQRMHYDPKAYACQVTGCPKKYTDRSNLWKHMRKHTADEKLEAKRKSAENKQKENNLALMKSLNSSNVLQCNWKGCYETCHSQAVLVNHIEKNHVHLQKGEQFTCFWIDCPRKSKPYPSKRNLSRHMSVHSGQKPYKCPFQGCHKAFSQSWNLRLHQRTSHTRERPYSCPFSNCFRSFITSYDRNNHQRMHYDPEAYACHVTGCSKKYDDPGSLKKHMKNHTVDEQLEAKRKLIKKKQKQCDFVLRKSFKSSDEANHQQTHCNTVQCRWKGCYQIYLSQTTLVKHIEMDHVQLRNGKEFSCFWIDCPRKLKPFTTMFNLSVHMRTHSGEKPHKCPFQGCNKAFTQRGALKVHQSSHTRKKPYLCQFSDCFKSFFTKYDRDYHQMMHYDTEASTCQVNDCSKKFADLNSLRTHMENHKVNEEQEVKQKENIFPTLFVSLEHNYSKSFTSMQCIKTSNVEQDLKEPS